MNNLSCRVLLVEDNEDDYLIVRDLLEDIATTAFDPEWVASAAAARAALASHRYEVCLLDYRLGEATGMELVREFAGGATPFILLTGTEDYAVDVAATQAGAADYLIKGHINALLIERSIRYAIERKRAEAIVAASEIRYRRLFESAHDGILILDAATHKITDVNPYMMELLDYSREEFLGKELWEIGLLKDEQANVEAFGVLQVNGYIRYDDLPLATKAGERREVEFVSNVYGENGHQVIQCNIRDNTEHRRAERESQRFLQATLDALSSHIAVLDEAGEIMAVNKAWRSFAAQNNGSAMSCGVGANYLEVCERAVGRWSEEGLVVAQGISNVMAGRQRDFCLEYPCHGEDEQRWFVVRATRFEGAGPVRVAVSHENITERKLAEESLRQSSALLRAVTEGTTDNIFAKDLGGRYLMINSAGARFLGHSVDEIVGKTDAEIVPSQAAQAYTGTDRRVIASGVVETHEETATVAGETRTYLTTKGPLRGPQGDVAGTVGVARDITERKQAEAELEATTRAIVTTWESMTDAFFSLDADWHFTHINSQAARLWDKDVADLIEKSIWETMPGILDSIVCTEFYRAREEQIAVDFEVFNPLRDVWREVHAYPSEVGLAVYFRDITDRKRAEAALRASEARFQSIVANVPGMVYQFMLHPDGSIAWPFVSEGCRELYGVEAEAIQLNPLLPLDAIHPDDRDELDRSVAASAATLLPWQWEGRLRLASGKIAWIQGAARPQRVDGGTLWDGLVMDITARKEAEDERDRFFMMSLDMLCIASLDGHFRRVNPAFFEILGFTEVEFQNRLFLDFVHPEDRAATLGVVEGLAHGSAVVGFENRYRTKSGSWRWLEWKAAAVPEAGLIYAAARDVTERKETETALLRLRDELEVRVQERTAELAQTNAALQIQIAEREGAEAETRARARQQEAVAELGHRALMEADIDTLLNGATALVAATLDVELSTILELLPGGDALRVRAANGWKGEAVGRQVPAHARSQAAYSLQSKAPIIVSDLRQETRFEPSSLMVEQGVVSGVTVILGGHEQPSGILGAHTVRQRDFTRDDVHFLQAMSNVLAAAIEQRRIETEIRELNTQLQHTIEQLRIENIERNMAMGALRASAVVLEQARDEAEQSRENAEIANLAKSEFLSRMSHELRTPLNAILGFGQIMEMDSRDDDPQQQDNIQQILKAGRHLLALINEVLDIARIEAGHLSLSPEPVAAGWVVREALDVVRPLAAARHIRLAAELPEERGELHVLADQQRLKQVLLNFLSNAVKYNRDGGHVIVSCEPAGDQTANYDGILCVGRLRLAVRDSGAGLTPEEMARLFVPFERLGAARSQIEGTGIGLSLCKRLVEAMHGQVGVVSEAGQGSSFWLELPLVQYSPAHGALHPAGTAEVIAAIKPGTPVFDSPRTILYIEDNLANISLIERLLSDLSQPIRLLPAMQGSMGLELAAQHRPDLILLDVNLPDIMGDAVLRRLKADPVTQAIPVVVLSADATPRQIERLLHAGAVDYLTKPLDVEQFFNVLREALQSAGAD